MSLRYNTFAGATATLGAHENVKAPTMADFRKATETVFLRLSEWEAQFQSFALSVGVDLDAGGVLVLPETFDMRDVPPRFLPQCIVQGTTFGLLRNPTGAPIVTDAPANNPADVPAPVSLQESA